MPRLVASAFLLIAVLVFIAAERRACSVHQRLHAHRVQTIRITRIRFITIVAVVATLALAAAMWLLTI